jgi:hypothetical protein
VQRRSSWDSEHRAALQDGAEGEEDTSAVVGANVEEDAGLGDGRSSSSTRVESESDGLVGAARVHSDHSVGIPEVRFHCKGYAPANVETPARWVGRSRGPFIHFSDQGSKWSENVFGTIKKN